MKTETSLGLTTSQQPWSVCRRGDCCRRHFDVSTLNLRHPAPPHLTSSHFSRWRAYCTLVSSGPWVCALNSKRTCSYPGRAAGRDHLEIFLLNPVSTFPFRAMSLLLGFFQLPAVLRDRGCRRLSRHQHHGRRQQTRGFHRQSGVLHIIILLYLLQNMCYNKHILGYWFRNIRFCILNQDHHSQKISNFHQTM